MTDPEAAAYEEFLMTLPESETAVLTRPKARQGDSTIAHLASQQNERKAICGASLRGVPARLGQGRCVVCFEMATFGRFAGR